MAAALWSRPRLAYLASFFSFTASTFSMTELNLSRNQLGVDWASLAIIHLLVALFLGRRSANREKRKSLLPAYRCGRLYHCGAGCAALALPLRWKITGVCAGKLAGDVRLGRPPGASRAAWLYHSETP